MWIWKTSFQARAASLPNCTDITDRMNGLPWVGHASDFGAVPQRSNSCKLVLWVLFSIQLFDRGRRATKSLALLIQGGVSTQPNMCDPAERQLEFESSARIAFECAKKSVVIFIPPIVRIQHAICREGVRNTAFAIDHRWAP